MKKILLFTLLISLVGCAQRREVKHAYEVASVQSDSKTITVRVFWDDNLFENERDFTYWKIKVEGHDMYMRIWETKYGHGSDLKHFPELCDKCK